MEIRFDKPMHVYFIGIGGVSMSGLASILLTEGFKVSGSDAKESELTEKLSKSGAKVYYGQKASNITKDLDLVVYTAAIHPDNPEYQAAVSLNLPMMVRAEFLGLLMKNYKNPIAISGTHGKTTTTSMISEILLKADFDPTISNGGIIKSINSTMRVGSPDYFVFEACEYTNSFLSFFPKVSVILNVEEDHLDFFKDINDIRNSFHRFALLLPSDGFLAINGEIDNFKDLTKDLSCAYKTFGLDSKFDYSASNITYNKEGFPSFVCLEKETGEKKEITISLPGEHNVKNALAAITVSRHFGVSFDVISDALNNFSGSKRRFEYKGKFNGVTVYDDYAHHPSEIKATLTAAKNKSHNRLWVIFQPHTYTRTKAFLNEFSEALSLADKVVLTDVYAAREKDEYGCNATNLYEKMKADGIDVTYIKEFSDIEKFVKQNCTKDDLLITMGAGDVVNIADKLVLK